MTAGQTLWAAIVLSVFAQIRGQAILTVSPPSVAATTGDQNITINCTVENPSGEDIAWNYRPSWSPNKDVLIFYSYGNKSLVDTANFSVALYDYESQGYPHRSADLTINTAKPELAATYTCSLTPTITQIGTSSFVVLDPLQCPAQDMNEYVDGTIVIISCSVNFYLRDDLARIPILEIFKGDPGIPLPSLPPVTTRNKITVSVNQTLRKEDNNAEFICRLRFANDDPVYTDNCSVVYYVTHEVSEITFQPPSSASNLTSIPVGGQITCAANGRPAPTITWYNVNGNQLAEGSYLTVTQDMQSWPQPVSVVCRANNTINNGLNYTSVDANYTFLVVEATSNVVQSSGVEAWKIALCVIIPVVVLTAIGIAIFFIIRHHKKKKKGKAKKTTNGSTIYNATATTAGAATTSSYTPVATSDPTYFPPNRPPPASATPLTSAYGPPGFDGRHDTVRYSPGFGDLGTQGGGSTQAVNAYPTRNSSSVHGSSQAIGGVDLSMNPNPAYQGARASNPALDVSSSSRPAYPYKGSNPRLDVSLSLNPNPLAAAAPPPGVGYGRPSSSASSTGRSLASGYNAQAMHGYPNDLSSMPGSEV